MNHAYVVYRIDLSDMKVNATTDDLKMVVTMVEIVWSVDIATAEAARLQKVAPAGTNYFWEIAPVISTKDYKKGQ